MVKSNLRCDAAANAKATKKPLNIWVDRACEQRKVIGFKQCVKKMAFACSGYPRLRSAAVLRSTNAKTTVMAKSGSKVNHRPSRNITGVS